MTSGQANLKGRVDSAAVASSVWPSEWVGMDVGRPLWVSSRRDSSAESAPYSAASVWLAPETARPRRARNADLLGSQWAQRRAAERSAAVQQEVRYAVARIAHEAGRRERVKVSGKIVDFVAALAENYAAQLTGDVCSFAKHARRSTVTPDDVRLCARNNESIADALGCLLLITSCVPWLFVRITACMPRSWVTHMAW